MKRSNKKGFTTVELVIVIAVIAILAAVLIPTFSNLIKKANQSADVQGARQMDVALQAESAVEKPADLKAVIEILDEAGFNIDSLKPITKGHTFYWDNQLNKIMLVEDETETVLYPEDATYIEGNAEDLMSGKGFIKVEAATSEDVVTALNNGQSVTLTEDVELDQPISIPAGADVTVDLNGKTLTTTESEPGKHQYAINTSGTVTVTNGTFNSRGIMIYSGSKLIIKDAVVNAMDDNGGACIRNKGGEVVIDGGTFNVTAYSDINTNDGGAPAVYNAGGTITINGGKFTSVTEAYLIINQSGTITINGGDFSAYRGAMTCAGGTITVNDGKFAVTNGANGGWLAIATGTGKIDINGGQFSTVVADHEFYGNVEDNR